MPQWGQVALVALLLAPLRGATASGPRALAQVIGLYVAFGASSSLLPLEV